MTKTVLKRQFITDAAGNPIGVILPLEEFALVEEILEQQPQTLSEADKLNQMEQAAHDHLFTADLRRQCQPLPDPGKEANDDRS